jgi:hypothetical protein
MTLGGKGSMSLGVGGSMPLLRILVEVLLSLLGSIALSSSVSVFSAAI